MTDGNERAKFSLADGRIKIEGSEKFVAEQLEKLEPLLTKMFEQRPQLLSAPRLSDTFTPVSSPITSGEQATSGGLTEYLNVFALSDEKVQILKSLPGKSKAEKTVNAALLLAFANELNGHKSTSMDEVRRTCSSHACLDSPNFTKPFNLFGSDSPPLAA